MFAVKADNKRTSQDLEIRQGCERGKRERESGEREERKGKRNKKMRLQSHAN